MKITAFLWLFVLFVIPFSSQADGQSDRAAFIERLKSKGIFQSTSVVGDAPRLVVTPDFYDSDLDSKETAVGIVYQYFLELDSAYDTLVIIDGTTGAQIGVYTAEGLQL